MVNTQSASVVVLASVISIGPKVRGFSACQGRWIFKLKVLSTPFYGGEVTSSVSCKILRHVKNHCGV
jgi:hypothetical protein